MSVDGVLRAIKRVGGVDKLPDVSGHYVPKFEPRALAEALEREIARAVENGFTKVSVHMDLSDAVAMARYMRG